MKRYFYLISLAFLIWACNNTETKKDEHVMQAIQKPIRKLDSISEACRKTGIDTTRGIPTGLKAGDIAPDFIALNHNLQPVSLYEELEKKEVVIFFYRGLWCLDCARHLVKLQTNFDKIKDLPISVWGITPEKMSGIQETAENIGIDFTIVSDSTMEIMDAYKVSHYVTDEHLHKLEMKLHLDPVAKNANGEARYPISATYIIGQDKKIRKVFFDLNYAVRATVDDIIEFLPKN